MNGKVNHEGFILYSTLISMTISVIVLTLLLGIVFYAVMWDAKLLDSVAMMEDGRYTRRMVVAQMIWNPVEVTVEDKNISLYIHDTKRTTLTVQRHALYRKLTDGSLQPVSGSRIIGTRDKRNVGYTQEHPFSLDDNKTVHLRWYINNRFTNNKLYTSGYGGLALYEVAIGQSAVYDWYKDNEETSHERRSHNAGFITYVAILTMSLLLLLAFMGLRISQICESNAIDELHLEEAHYAAQRGAHWFVGYCKAGNTWDFQQKLIVSDEGDVEITIEPDRSMDNPRHVMSYGKLKNREIVSRVHMYVTVDQDKQYACGKGKTLLR